MEKAGPETDWTTGQELDCITDKHPDERWQRPSPASGRLAKSHWKQRESTLGCRTVQAQCCQGDEL